MENDSIIDLVTKEGSEPFSLEFEGFIGQVSAVNKIRFFIRSHSKETPFPTLLLSGSHGLGKTYLAEKTANNIGRRFVSVNCGEIKKADEFIDRILLPISYKSEPTTIFLDESHSLSKDITTLLLTLLNPSSTTINMISHNGYKIAYDMSLINVIFATTDAHEMFKPLRNRCETVYFYPYEDEEIMDILNFYLKDIDLRSNPKSLSDACRNRARDAFVLSQNIKRYCNMYRVNYLNDEHWSDLRNIFDIRPLGLRREEVDLLEVVSNHEPISCANIALKLMVNEDNVKSELEIRLRELGMICSTTKGRVLTNEGRNYINDYVDKKTK